MKKLKKSMLATFAMFMVLANSASAQPAGSGPGAMGGRGMGPHMMDGYGMGPGMMGGYGMGFGMMGGCGSGGMAAYIPDLTNEQQTKISDIQKELRQKQWALMEKMHEDMQSGNFYRGGKFDDQAARKAYDRHESMHKQMFENALDAQKRIDNVLTPRQREQLQRASTGR